MRDKAAHFHGHISLKKSICVDYSKLYEINPVILLDNNINDSVFFLKHAYFFVMADWPCLH